MAFHAVEVVVVSKLWITVPYLVFYLCCIPPQAVGQEAQTPHPKKVWTNDDLKRGSSDPVANTTDAASPERPADDKKFQPYRREKDPHWYVRQLNPLRRELVTVEANLRGLLEASKDGKGASNAVNLDQEEEGVTTEGQVSVLKARRDELLKRIDELEEQARHNGILPGELREETDEAVEGTSENSAVAADGVSGEKSNAVRELEEAVEAEKAHLAYVNKEVDLLRRDQRLEEQKEFSNPEPRSRRDPRSKLAEITSDLTGKETEVEDSEHRIAELEDRLENARRLSSIEARKETAHAGDLPDQVGDNHAEGSQNNEAFWRKQFSEIDYKARVAKKELDILQREHNVLLLQYYSNPATAMKESETRKDINSHRDAVEAKQRELAELRKQREDLEDALRHAGGPPAWAR